jgi:RNA-directed DNA polymerase
MSKLIAWKEVDWKLVQKRLSRQQRRVYRASMEGNRSKVHAIQRRIIGSLDAKLMAVRRVTTENKGRNTAGVDGQKSLSHQDKIKLVQKLKLDGNTSSIRRTYIPKPGKAERRPLGIPTIEDRAKQMLAKLALEPEWEATFEPNSYGFRPGRSCHDAISSLFLSLRGKSRYVLDADIQKCFDKIDHEKLLRKINTFDLMEYQIRAWLKADIMVGYLNRPDEVFHSMEGTPQGGVISPLLANIALHGLEDFIKDWYATSWYPKTGQSAKVPKRDRRKAIGFSRYADDFVVTAPTYQDVKEIEKQVEQWLEREAGLSLSKAKTRIVNSTEGFEFLGFQLVSVKRENNVYRLKIHPSKKSKAQLIQRVRKIVQTNRSASSYNLIVLLSSRIIGWANYFRYSECMKDFGKMDHLIYQIIRAWVFRRKSKGLNSRTKLKEKYFPTGKTYRFRGKTYTNNWILTGQTKVKGKEKEVFLPKLVWISSGQHVKIKGKASPYNGDHVYWAVRTERYAGYNHRISKLLKFQKGVCPYCREAFTPMDTIEVDHIVPRSQGGSDRYVNLQALHKHCHIQKSYFETSVSMSHSRSWLIGREPDEAKVSRPDRKTSVGRK